MNTLASEGAERVECKLTVVADMVAIMKVPIDANQFSKLLGLLSMTIHPGVVPITRYAHFTDW
jgi:hypothetical protein